MKKPLRGVSMDEELVFQVLEYARGQYPREIMLLLRGDRDGEFLRIKEVLSPPLQYNGRDFASVNVFYTPFTPSIIGTMHSHPSGVLKPSLQDLLSFMGKVMGIAAYPFEGKEHIAFFNRDGYEIPLFYSRTQPFAFLK
ncbi:MAG: metalloprotease [Candidatus Marsarchaeota archaeon]